MRNILVIIILVLNFNFSAIRMMASDDKPLTALQVMKNVPEVSYSKDDDHERDLQKQSDDESFQSLLALNKKMTASDIMQATQMARKFPVINYTPLEEKNEELSAQDYMKGLKNQLEYKRSYLDAYQTYNREYYKGLMYITLLEDKLKTDSKISEEEIKNKKIDFIEGAKKAYQNLEGINATYQKQAKHLNDCVLKLHPEYKKAIDNIMMPEIVKNKLKQEEEKIKLAQSINISFSHEILKNSYNKRDFNK